MERNKERPNHEMATTGTNEKIDLRRAEMATFRRLVSVVSCSLLLSACKFGIQSEGVSKKAVPPASVTGTEDFAFRRDLGSAAARQVGMLPGNLPEIDLSGKLPISAVPGIAELRASMGSVVVHWGHANLPADAASRGATLLYGGSGFGSYYDHARGREAECIKGKDPGEPWKGAWSDALYPLSTGTAQYLPNAIAELKLVACSVLFIPSSTTFVLKGSDSCPVNWSKVYAGYLFGGHSSHTGAGVSSLCVDSEKFDVSKSYNPSSHYSFIYGTQIHDAANQVVGADENYKFLKCALCAKD